MKDKPRILGAPVDQEQLQEDLKKYQQKALELGASGAVAVPVASIEVDERVRLKCLSPRCNRAGQTPNCPPNAPDLKLVRKALARYQWAILIKCDVDVAEFDPAKAPSRKPKEGRHAFHSKGNQLVEELERLAFRDGYHLAMGFGGGSCRDDLCGGEPCQVMERGECRHPYQSRPSMEAIGIDVMPLVYRAGWAAYAMQEKITTAMTVGIVFVA